MAKLNDIVAKDGRTYYVARFSWKNTPAKSTELKIDTKHMIMEESSWDVEDSAPVYTSITENLSIEEALADDWYLIENPE